MWRSVVATAEFRADDDENKSVLRKIPTSILAIHNVQGSSSLRKLGMGGAQKVELQEHARGSSKFARCTKFSNNSGREV